MSSSSTPLPPPILVYHESARSIVFRDHIRRQHSIIKKNQDDSLEKQKTPTLSSSFEEKILNYTPKIDPLPSLQSHAGDDFELLLKGGEDGEGDAVMTMMREERCVVKTIRNADWTAFLKRLKESLDKGEGFKSSCSLLPSGGYKMRCFGSLKEYSTGVIFPLPSHTDAQSEQDAITESQTFIWPAGYSAKTEFNIDHRGRLLNGRDEAIVTIKELRQLNDDYLHKTDYKLYNRLVKGGLTTIPYNEMYLNIGGHTPPTYHSGIGPPIGLFCRTASYGDIIHLLRTRARYASTMGIHYSAINLYHLSPTEGLRPFTKRMEEEFWHYAASHLDPFQNPHIKHKTTISSNHPLAMKQKLEELINLDEIRSGCHLTGDELARIAGGFGATDDSVAKLLMDVMTTTSPTSGDGGGMNKLQEVVNDGLTSAVRSGDYHTSRQLLILYTLVATKGGYESDDASQGSHSSRGSATSGLKMLELKGEENSAELIKHKTNEGVVAHRAPLPPPPPPLDTERLRSATNSDGLLSVLGAAEVLKAMQDGSAKRRMEEVIRAVEEWIEEGEQNMTFRLTSWHNQRVAQGDLQIATNKDTAFGAFISGKAVSNRRKFVKDLRHAISHATTTPKEEEDVENIFETVSFLHDIHKLCAELRSPCLRLELLQYILGLDNRYSVAHVARSVELAATCLNIRMAAGDDPGVAAAAGVDDGDHKVDDGVRN